MKELKITTKTKVVKKQIESFQEILAKYRKQKTKIVKKQTELKNKMNALDYFTQQKEYEQASKDYSNNEKKLTKTNFYIKNCESFRNAWLELYTFNILKDNKEIITQPLYYKKEQNRLFEHFDFNGLEFKVYKRDIYTSYYNGLVMFEKDGITNSRTILNEEYLDDLSLMTEPTLRYRWESRYITAENFEDFTKNKYKQIIKIAKKAQKFIDIIQDEQEKLGDHFKYQVARLELQNADDWQKNGKY